MDPERRSQVNSTRTGFCVILSDPNPEPESKFVKNTDPVSSEISDLLLFFSYFASQNKEIKSGN